MKKIIIILFIVTIITINKKEVITIPEESIRFRIIANSNETKDQITKMEVLSEIHPILTENNLDSIENSRMYINDSISKITPILEEKTIDYEINYGTNYFPEKNFKGVKYEDGEYESLVIELGEAKGDNWWCVLFPPLCLLEAEESELDDMEYKLFVQEILNN